MEGKENKKKRLGLIGALLVLLLMLILIAVGAFLYTRFARVGGEVVRTDVAELDLQGQGLDSVHSLARFRELKSLDLRGNEISAGDLDYLRKHLPDCDIRFDVPLGGQVYDSRTRELTLPDLPEQSPDRVKGGPHDHRQL